MKRVLVGMVVAALLMGMSVAWAADGPVLEPERVMTQGEFAILMARSIVAKEPQEGYTTEEAVNFLTGLGVMPKDGWNANADLTEGAMVELVRFIGVHLSTLDPNLLVTVAKANLVFRRYERRFRTYILYKMNADNWTDSTILDEGDVTGLPGISAR